MKIVFKTLFLVLASVQLSQGQIKIFIEPEYNFYKQVGRIEKGIAGNALFQPLRFSLQIDGGISTSVRINTHAVKFGYRLSGAGLMYKIVTPAGYVKKAGGGPYNSSKVSGVGLFTNQVYLSHSYLFKTKSFLPLYHLDRDDPRQKFLFRFAWFSLAGVSLDWYSPTTHSSEDASFSFAPTTSISIQEAVEYKFLRRNNVSVQLGGGIQFFHKNKERLKVSLVYSQGLFRFYEFPITVTFDGKTEYQGLMSTRGSYIGLFVSYPFLVWSNKRILKKRGLLILPDKGSPN